MTRPDDPRVLSLLGELDAYLAGLYAPHENHILDPAALLGPDVYFLGAWNGERLLGCGATRRMAGEPTTQGQSYGEIKRMIVRDEARGQGLARQLLGELEADLQRRGLRWARLETGRDQLAAVRLYERCGYRSCAAFAGYPDNGLSLFMGKELGA